MRGEERGGEGGKGKDGGKERGGGGGREGGGKATEDESNWNSETLPLVSLPHVVWHPTHPTLHTAGTYLPNKLKTSCVSPMTKHSQEKQVWQLTMEGLACPLQVAQQDGVGLDHAVELAEADIE